LPHPRPHPSPLQLRHAVGSKETPGSNLAKRGSLFKDRHSNTMRNQSVRSEETADTSAHDHDAGPFAAHHQLLAMTAPKYSGYIVVSSHRLTQSRPHKGRPSERRTSWGSFDARPASATFFFRQSIRYGAGTIFCCDRTVAKFGARRRLP